MKASLSILGCGSALPTKTHFPTSQILEMRDKQFMIDCGEGAQIRLRQMGIKTNRLGHIFISHLHGDHCFGLLGLISTFGMMSRTADLHIHGPVGMQNLFQPQLDFFCDEMPFQIIFHEFDTSKHALIYDDRSVSVYSIPLKHRVPCAGFLFEEKPADRHILREMIDFYQVPIAAMHKIKAGEDFVKPDGTIVPNERLTKPATPPLKYAYCSDTAYSAKIIPIIAGVDWLYHEATFAESELLRARQTLHSTAAQAARIAMEAGVKNLIIGHFSARYSNLQLLLAEAHEVFPQAQLAEDLKVFELR